MCTKIQKVKDYRCILSSFFLQQLYYSDKELTSHEWQLCHYHLNDGENTLNVWVEAPKQSAEPYVTKPHEGNQKHQHAHTVKRKKYVSYNMKNDSKIWKLS